MIFSYFYDVVCCTYCFLEGTERESSNFFSLQASSFLGGVARSHARVARERRREFERSTRSRVISRPSRNRELARAQANFLRFSRQRSRVVSASDSQWSSPGFEFRSVLGHTCNLSQTDHLGLFFKISLSSVSMQPSSWAVSISRTPHFQTLVRLMTSHSSLSATTGYNFGPSVYSQTKSSVPPKFRSVNWLFGKWIR